MSPLPSRRSLNLLCALSVLGGIAAGCNSSGARRSFTTIGPPAMPQVNATPSYDSRTKSESEVVAAALQLARAGDHAGAAAEIAMPRDPFDRARMAGQVAATLAAGDPGMAAEFARALPWGGAQAAAVEAVAQAYAGGDPQPAIDWALTWTDVHSGRVARHAVARALVARDARDAIERITRRPVGVARDDLLVAAAGAWARRDAPAALTWLRGWPEDELKPRLTSGIGFEIAQSQPARAVDVAELMPAGRNRWLLLSAIAQTWVAIDAKEALA